MRNVANSVVVERMTKELGALAPLISGLSQVSMVLRNECDDKTFNECLSYLATVANKGNEVIARWTQYANNYKAYTLEEDERRARAEAKAEEQANIIKEQMEKISVLSTQVAALEIYKDQQEALTKVRKANKIINTNVVNLAELIEEKQKEIISILETVRQSTNSTEEIKALQKDIREALKETETGKKFKQNQGRLKNQGKGENSIRFNHNIDSEKLIEEYKQAGNRITSEMTRRYSAKGITYQGLRKRLITEGVWNPTPRARKDND